jgi:type III restriction enzyme
MLREVGSLKERRQTIGRGLRLPVNQDGERVWDEGINKLTVVATESYADFAEGLQKEYEEECGVTFGKVPKNAFARLQLVVDGESVEVGRVASEKISEALAATNMIDANGKIKSNFKPQVDGFTLNLPDDYKPLEAEIISVLQSYQLERHIKKDEEPKALKINKRIFLDPEFATLWEKIKNKTTYEVKYDTTALIANAAKAIKGMDKIESVKVTYKEAQLELENKGIIAQETRVNYHTVTFTGNVPDIVAYIQKETELTRRTIVEILVQSGRLNDFIINPQKFMDAASAIISRELHKMMIDGIKYERITDEEWAMREFEEKEVLSYLYNRLDVSKSVYDAIVYDSEIERKFAEALEKREDIKLFVKLPSWFQVETPVGTYNPDWAIVKYEDETIYLVRETKGTKDYEKLRNTEADKIKCGRRHFEAIGADFEVVTSTAEI